MLDKDSEYGICFIQMVVASYRETACTSNEEFVKKRGKEMKNDQTEPGIYFSGDLKPGKKFLHPITPVGSWSARSTIRQKAHSWLVCSGLKQPI
jgi:hypothetical protein